MTRAFVSLAVGERPTDARTVLASDDPAVVRAVLRAVRERVPAEIRAAASPKSETRPRLRPVPVGVAEAE